MELGVYSFGDVQRDPATGELGSTTQAQRNLLEAIRLADEVGLDCTSASVNITPRKCRPRPRRWFWGRRLGDRKHHPWQRGLLVLSTDDPVRVYQQFATLDALSNGRAEITAGRGSSTESFSAVWSQPEPITTIFMPKSWTCCCGSTNLSR